MTDLLWRAVFAVAGWLYRDTPRPEGWGVPRTREEQLEYDARVRAEWMDKRRRQR